MNLTSRFVLVPTVTSIGQVCAKGQKLVEKAIGKGGKFAGIDRVSSGEPHIAQSDFEARDLDCAHSLADRILHKPN